MKKRKWFLFVSQPGSVAFLISVLVIIPAVSFSQGLPAVPKVITQTTFEFQGKAYVLEVEPGKEARVAKGNLYCANPDQRPELDCRNCSLVLRQGQKELSRISLGSYRFVYGQGEWHVTGSPPLNMIKKSGELPLISVSQYASCNSNIYQFYRIEVQNDLILKPVRFMGFGNRTKENGISASIDFKSAVQLVETSRFYQRELWVSGYNNADIGSFVFQFGELSPGQWNCIGFYTQAGGSLPEMQKKLLEK